DTSLENKSGRTYILCIPQKESMYYDPKKTVPHNKNWVVN
ncbi:lytic transglycosylase domain-containing protein, partial [Bacteroides sp. OttesenSCG-928-J23]|nr:lytic transglycosylase domain-containing protein [Bacteroides sp. OttesenSCG-928-J23]